VIELWDKKGGLKYGSKGLSLSKIIITEKKRKVYGGRWCLFIWKHRLVIKREFSGEKINRGEEPKEPKLWIPCRNSKRYRQHLYIFCVYSTSKCAPIYIIGLETNKGRK
jgi:hypothetical protein